jgi:hypothetical protein
VSLPRSVFVGRKPELTAIAARLDQALVGHGGVVLMAGESGIGKTRLAEELVALARKRGSAVWWDRCYEGEGAPALRQHLLYTGVRDDGPFAVRMPGGAGADVSLDSTLRELPVGKGELQREGADAVILAYGRPVPAALEAAERLTADGIECAVVNARWAKPLDEELILNTCPWTRSRWLVLHLQVTSGRFHFPRARAIRPRHHRQERRPLERLNSFAQVSAEHDQLTRLDFPDMPFGVHLQTTVQHVQTCSARRCLWVHRCAGVERDQRDTEVVRLGQRLRGTSPGSAREVAPQAIDLIGQAIRQALSAD